jgi:hypothetical protein
MNKLSITTAWNETAAFVKSEWGTLLLIAFAFQTLPSIALQFFLPSFLGPSMIGPNGQLDPAVLANPDALFARLAPLLPIGLVLGILGLLGTLTMMTLALRRAGTVGEAIAHSARRLLPVIGATLLLSLAMMVGAGIIAAGAAAAGRAILLVAILLIFIALIFVVIRFLLVNAVAAGENEGPIGILRRSWALTAGHFWRIFGAMVLILIAFLVIMIVVSLISGILIAMLFGMPAPGSLAALILMLVNGVVSAGFVVFYSVMIARIYAQLAGDGRSSAAVFE